MNRAWLFRQAHEAIPYGVALVGPSDAAKLCGVDADGVMWEVGAGTRRQLVRFAAENFLRVYPSRGLLLDAMRRGLAEPVTAEVARSL